MQQFAVRQDREQEQYQERSVPMVLSSHMDIAAVVQAISYCSPVVVENMQHLVNKEKKTIRIRERFTIFEEF